MTIGSVERVLSGVLTLSAAVIAVALAHREFGRSTGRGAPNTNTPPSYVKNWNTLLQVGELVGSADAPVKVIEFGDFECPFCRRSDSLYRVAASKFGQSVALIFVHFPLGIHRFAVPAARASECAARQGRFAAFHDKLYDRQDSLGLKTWTSFAVDAGVPDTAAFGACVQDVKPVSQIQAGLDAGKRFNVNSTPPVLVNGWRFQYPPNGEQLDSIIAAFSAPIAERR